MRTLILGDGILGTELRRQSQWNYISRKKDAFDIRDKDIYKTYFLQILHGAIVDTKCDTIVNCIAHTDVYTEDKTLHWDINYKSVIDLSNFCHYHNIKLVHISSSYVYANSKEETTEDDIPIHANNWYSYTKLLGDSYVQLFDKNLIIRTLHKELPFKYKKAWINQIGNFDYVNTIGSLIISLINKNANGVYNVGTQLKTMHDLAIQTKPETPPALIPNLLIPNNVTMNVSKMLEFLNK